MSNTNKLLKSLKGLNKEKNDLHMNVKEMTYLQMDLKDDTEKYQKEINSLEEMIGKIEEFKSKKLSLKKVMNLNLLNVLVVVLFSIFTFSYIETEPLTFWVYLLVALIYSSLIVISLGNESEWSYKNLKNIIIDFKNYSRINENAKEKILNLSSKKQKLEDKLDYTGYLKRESARTLLLYNQMMMITESKLNEIKEEIFQGKDCIVRFNFS